MNICIADGWSYSSCRCVHEHYSHYGAPLLKSFTPQAQAAAADTVFDLYMNVFVSLHWPLKVTKTVTVTQAIIILKVSDTDTVKPFGLG